MKVVVAYDSDEQPWSHKWKNALASGIRACGDEVVLTRAREVAGHRGDVTVTWGLRGGRSGIMREQRKRGLDHLVMERGFIGDRLRWTALGFNGIGGKAKFHATPEDGGTRFKVLFEDMLRPWRPIGGTRRALIAGQVVGDMTHRFSNIDEWYERTSRELVARGWQVFFRPHPIERSKSRKVSVRGVPTAEDMPLHKELERTDLFVTFNSTSAVEAVLAGVRTYAADPGSPAWEVVSHDLDNWSGSPSRESWANALAWKQWSLDEVSSGEAWSRVRTAAARQ